MTLECVWQLVVKLTISELGLKEVPMNRESRQLLFSAVTLTVRTVGRLSSSFSRRWLGRA